MSSETGIGMKIRFAEKEGNTITGSQLLTSASCSLLELAPTDLLALADLSAHATCDHSRCDDARHASTQDRNQSCQIIFVCGLKCFSTEQGTGA